MSEQAYNFIVFRVDRLGDFIIHSRPIYELKKKYPNSFITIVCSNINRKIISKYKFVDEIIIYNKFDSLLIKLKTFIKIIKKKYHASFVLDGRKFSYFCNMFINSKKKFGVAYIRKKKIFGVSITKNYPFSIYRYLFFSKYEVFTSKSSLTHSENFCQKYINLFNELNIKKITPKSSYIFETNESSYQIYQKMISKLDYKNFLIVHLDEKWNDIDGIENFLVSFFENLQKNSNCKIIITAYNNNFKYFKNLKLTFPYFDYINNPHLNNLENYVNSNVIILDNLEIFVFENFLRNSVCNISCHAGFVAQVSGANNAVIIDIINDVDYIWYSCWKPLNTIHNFIFKSINQKKINLHNISIKISNLVNNIRY